MSDVTRTRCPVWVKIVLALSLALNFAIIGLVAGFFLRGPGPLRAGGPGLSYALPYVAAFSRDDRRAVMGAVRNDPDLPSRAQRRAQFEDMLAALRAETLDVAAVRDILARQEHGVAQLRATARGVWLDRVVAMSTAERLAYADAIEEVLKRGPRKRKDGPGKDRDR